MNFITFAKWLETAPEWIVGLPKWCSKFFYQLWQTFICEDRWQMFLSGLEMTFIVTIGALILGVIIGMLVAVIRSSHDLSRGKPNFILRFFNSICKIYITVNRLYLRSAKN